MVRVKVGVGENACCSSRPVESHSGTREKHYCGPPKHFHGALLGTNFLIFFSKWYILAYFIFLADGGAPNIAGPG